MTGIQVMDGPTWTQLISPRECQFPLRDQPYFMLGHHLETNSGELVYTGTGSHHSITDITVALAAVELAPISLCDHIHHPVDLPSP
jgi:hypothetical protein